MASPAQWTWVWTSSGSWWCHLTMLSSEIPFSCLQSFPASRSFQMTQFFTSGGQSIGFSFSISPSTAYSVLNSFRMDWLGLLAVQGTLKSLLQHHSSKASILWRSAFLTVQLSYPYMTTGKTIALIRWTFVGKVMSLLFNLLSRLVITFLPRSKRQACLMNCGLRFVTLHRRKILSWPKSSSGLFPYSGNEFFGHLNMNGNNKLIISRVAPQPLRFALTRSRCFYTIASGARCFLFPSSTHSSRVEE